MESYLELFKIFTEVHVVAAEKKGKYFLSGVGAYLYSKLRVMTVPGKLVALTFPEIWDLL